MVLFLFLFNFFYLFNTCASSLNFWESHQLQFADSYEIHDWFIPSYIDRPLQKNHLEFIATSNKDFNHFFTEATSKNQSRVNTLVLNSFGKLLDAEYKIAIRHEGDQLFQSISANLTGGIIINNPIFPTFKAQIIQDARASTGFNFTLTPHWHHIVFLNYGVRKYLSEEKNVGDLVVTPYKLALNSIPWKGIANLNWSSYFATPYLQFIAEINSLPIISDYSYWNTFVGLRTPNWHPAFLDYLFIFTGYSPLYSGNYEQQRTIRSGITIGFSNHFKADVVTFDGFNLALNLSFHHKNIEASLFTLERSLDDYHIQTSRQYGINFGLGY